MAGHPDAACLSTTALPAAVSDACLLKCAAATAAAAGPWAACHISCTLTHKHVPDHAAPHILVQAVWDTEQTAGPGCSASQTPTPFGFQKSRVPHHSCDGAGRRTPAGGDHDQDDNHHFPHNNSSRAHLPGAFLVPKPCNPIWTPRSQAAHHSSDGTGRGASAGVDHDQELHEVVVHGGAGGLHQEHVAPSYGLLHLDVDLPVRKALDADAPQLQAQIAGHLLRQALRPQLPAQPLCKLWRTGGCTLDVPCRHTLMFGLSSVLRSSACFCCL